MEISWLLDPKANQLDKNPTTYLLSWSFLPSQTEYSHKFHHFVFIRRATVQAEQPRPEEEKHQWIDHGGPDPSPHPFNTAPSPHPFHPLRPEHLPLHPYHMGAFSHHHQLSSPFQGLFMDSMGLIPDPRAPLLIRPGLFPGMGLPVSHPLRGPFFPEPAAVGQRRINGGLVATEEGLPTPGTPRTPSANPAIGSPLLGNNT